MTLSMLPKAYLAIKDAILREFAINGSLTLAQVKQLVKVESHKASRLFEYFVDMGWISSFK